MTFLKNPRLKPNYHFERINDEQVLLTSNYSGNLLSGKLHGQILEKVANQEVSTEDLLFEWSAEVFPHQILQVLAELEQEGYLTEAYPTGLSDATAAYWEDLGMKPARVVEILKTKRISVKGLGKTDPTAFVQACAEIGIQLSENADLQVIIASAYDYQGLEELNKEALQTKIPWLLIQPTGMEALVGPLFVPEQTACWQCLAHRLDLNQPHKRFYEAVKPAGKLDYPVIQHPAVAQIIYQLTSLEIVKWFYEADVCQLENQLLTFDSQSMELTKHQLVKRPQCKACGNSKTVEPKAITLQKVETSAAASNGYRAVSAAETFAKYQHHISKFTGIIPFMKPYPQSNHLVHNYSAGQNLALSSKSMFWLNQHRRSSNSGKGKTAIQAKVSALGEAIERYSAMFHEDDHSIWASFQELENAIHPNTCMNFSEAQFANRENLNAANDRFYALIPQPLDEQEKIAWTAVYSLTHQQFKYLPSAFCYAQYPGKDEAKLYAYPDSNGCAAGNSLEEAILQGFLELIERDAVAIWWYNRIRRPAIDLSDFQNEYVQEILKFYQQKNRSLQLLDITTDLGIPCFVAISHNLNPTENDHILFGFGTHVDATIAIERAITELNQLLPVISEKGYHTEDQVFLNWLKTAKLEEQAFMIPLKEGTKQPSDFPLSCKPTIYDSLQHCMTAVAQQGMETLVLDLTQPDIGMPVAKVIVPGLRHFWKRLALGRLYDVPVKMGWIAKKLKEEELNPLGFFL